MPQAAAAARACRRRQWIQGELGEDRDGHLSPGHNSCLFQPESGKYFIIFHSRFENHGEEHQVRVHQMFFNADGWPVIAPYRYAGEERALVDDGNIPGTYKLLDHGRSINTECILSQEITLEKNGKISGAVSGSWALEGESAARLDIDGKTCTGVFLMRNACGMISFTRSPDSLCHTKDSGKSAASALISSVGGADTTSLISLSGYLLSRLPRGIPHTSSESLSNTERGVTLHGTKRNPSRHRRRLHLSGH